MKWIVIVKGLREDFLPFRDSAKADAMVWSDSFQYLMFGLVTSDEINSTTHLITYFSQAGSGYCHVDADDSFILDGQK